MGAGVFQRTARTRSQRPSKGKLMETRANFIIIGLFTLLGILGGLGFFVWIASVQIDRQYAQYGVLFDDVSGLNQSADVLFNGVSVGRVVGIRIWEQDPSKVYVAVEIDATTPVTVDTVAQLESQGVTGVAYIALSSGSSGATLLTPRADGPPIIVSRRSSMQSLVSSAPDLLGDAATLIKQLETATGSENQAYVSRILQNVDGATARLDAALTDFSDMSASLRTAVDEVSVFTQSLDEIGDAATSTLTRVDTTLDTVSKTFETADQSLQALTPVITAANDTFAAIPNTLQNADQALLSAEQILSRTDAIIATDIGPAIADARVALAAITQTMAAIKTDVPFILADLRAAVSEARTAIATATPGLRDIGRLGSEARTLIGAISDLVRKISRDPTGFLLDNRVPDYRR
ncbi:MAG: phospholipid/cholesterol/gamma-HCH transport system substrate-binding protein [Yoonia sp.]